MRQFVVTYENGQPSGMHIRDAVLFAESACNRSNLAGLTNSVHTTELQDGSIVRVQVLNDIVRVHIELLPVQLHGNEESDKYNFIETEEYKVISFVSGVASDSLDSVYPVQGNLKTGHLFNQSKLFKKIRLHSHLTVIVENEIASSDAFSVGMQFIQAITAQYSDAVTAFKFLADGTVVYSSSGYHLFIGSKAKEKFSYSMIDEEYVPSPTARQVFPGKYTGNMRPLVQLLMGVGRMFKTGDFFDLWLQATKQSTPSSLTLSLVDNASKRVYFTCDTANVPSISNFKNDEESKPINIRFDYRWHKTHGIMWGRRNVTNALIEACDGIAWLAPFCADPQRNEEPFLVEIGYRGVYVAPLFRDIASFFDEVRNLYKQVYPEIEMYKPFKLGTATLFEALGGFPLNDCFPIDQSILDRWCRSGYVVKADIDLSDFYADGNYYESISHGWAFADTANETVNITIRRTPDVHLGKRLYSKCYKLTFDIQYNNFAGRVNPNGLALLNVFKFRDYCDYIKALLLPDVVIDQIIFTASSNLDAAQQMFDDYVVEPIFSVVVDKVVVEQGYLEEYKSRRYSFNSMYYTSSLRLWDDVLGNVKLFDCVLFYDQFLDQNPHLIPSGNSAPMYVTYINDSLRILMHNGTRLKKRDTGNASFNGYDFSVDLCLRRMNLDDGERYCWHRIYLTDDSHVPYNSRFYFTDREIRPTPGVLYHHETTARAELLSEERKLLYTTDDYNFYKITRQYYLETVSYIYNRLFPYNDFDDFYGFFVQAANDRSVLFAYFPNLERSKHIYSTSDVFWVDGVPDIAIPKPYLEDAAGVYKYLNATVQQTEKHEIIVYGLPDLDGTVLKTRYVTAIDDQPVIYEGEPISIYWYDRRKVPPQWFVAYNYYGEPYFATNVDWGSDQLYVKGNLTVGHVPVNAMFFGIVT